MDKSGNFVAGGKGRLRFAPDVSGLRLRELTGHDEWALEGTATSDAIALLNRLIIQPAGVSIPAEEMIAADRDRLLAEIYQRTFGDRIENVLTCPQCRGPFDIDFSLDALLATIERRDPVRVIKPLGENLFESENGMRFRLPNGRDEQDLDELNQEEAEAFLIRRCMVGDSAPTDDDDLQELLSEVAPLVDLEMSAKCPECAHMQALHFDIQGYLLNALLGRRGLLSAEIHRLAVTYHWSLQEILSLTGKERARFVAMIESESERRRHALS